MLWKTLSCAFILFIFYSCKHTHDVDPLLVEADRVQHEAIALGEMADSILDARLAQGKNAWNIDSLKLLKSEVANWKIEMVGVPGIHHDHDHSEHEGHDHAHAHEGHDHTHDHGNQDIGAQLSPAENKKVQEEWKIRIEQVLSTLKQN
ncbi:MAG: hypothetical protein IPK35_14210 [Saprospiraceae bacterium]|jgi:ABC-type Zn2+ transport system substrate-binding protein/surface adhesin|nr:hypothetical protein [Saprospiraceae bacterium]